MLEPDNPKGNKFYSLLLPLHNIIQIHSIFEYQFYPILLPFFAATFVVKIIVFFEFGCLPFSFKKNRKNIYPAIVELGLDTRS